MTNNLYSDNTDILFNKIFIRADTVNDIGLDVVGKISISGDIYPTVDNTYILGSSSMAWKDVYIGPGSLYVNNKKIISDESDTINISTDINQNLKFKTSGTGTLQFESSGTADITLTTPSGNIELKSTVEVLATKKIISSDGNDIKFGNGIVLDSGKNITLSGGGDIIGTSVGGWEKNGDTIYFNDKVGFGISNPLDSIHSSGAIIIGNSNVNTPGSIRWTGADFQGKKNADWVSLTSLLPSSASNNNITTINGLHADGDIEITGTLTKDGVNGGVDLLAQIATNKTDIATNVTNIALKANKASPTFTGTVTGSNFTLTGTLNKSTVLGGADLLAQIATNKADIATEKSRVDGVSSLTNEDLITFNNIVSAYESVDTGVTSALFTLQSDHIIDITNLQDTKQDKGIFTQDLIPSLDNEYSIGSPEFWIRDMYISENSLWIGDTHKIGISDGKIKFRKRKTNEVPAAVTDVGGNAAAALLDAGVVSLSDMKLKDWKKYMRTLTGQTNAKTADIFRNDSEDYEEDNNMDDYQDLVPELLDYDTGNEFTDDIGVWRYLKNWSTNLQPAIRLSPLGVDGAKGAKGTQGSNGSTGATGGPWATYYSAHIDAHAYGAPAAEMKNTNSAYHHPCFRMTSNGAGFTWVLSLSKSSFCFMDTTSDSKCFF